MTTKPDRSTSTLWARFRFSVVGSLLSSPPAQGELKAALRFLAAKTWTHPVTRREVCFSAITIERWYYKARREKDDPVGVLRRAVRKDCGKVSLASTLAERLFLQYREHKHWSYQLHYDNLAAVVKGEPSLGAIPSYSTIRRYMQAHGMLRKPRPTPKGRPGEARAVQRREEREIRSYEAEYVGSLWHLDFHHGSLKVLTSRGQWQRPLALGILDDHSRLCCHLQWYLSETAEDLVHGISQAIQKRGLPRALLTAKRLRPRLLLLDPLVRLHGIDENHAGEVAGLLAYFRSLQRELDLSVVLVHHTRKNAAGGVAAGQGLRGSSDLHAFGDSNLYLRRTSQRLVLSSEHRAAPASPPVYLELVATNAQTTHLEVVAELDGQKRGCLQEQALALLAGGAVQTRAALRDAIGVKNQRLGEALESLEQAGQIRRTPTGWQRID